MNIGTKQRRIGLVALIVVMVATAAYFIRNRSPDEPVFYGNVDIREVTVGFRVSGRLTSLGVDEGDVVKAGQELARLDTVPLKLAADEAHANASAAAAKEALLKSGFRSGDVEQARALVAERKAALQNAEDTLARQTQLKGTGAVARRVYDDALAARDEARARLRAAEQSLSELASGYRKQEIEEATANRMRAEALAAQADQNLSDAILNAPSDGTVLTRSVESGAILAPGAPVFTISLNHPVWARIFVAEPDLGKVAPGRDVLLYTDARPDRPYHGRVGYVSPVAEFTPKNVETTELRTALVYRARVVVNDADEGLRRGMPVTVQLADVGSTAGQP